MSSFEIVEAGLPASDDEEAWKKFWKSKNQPWRTEPRISKERQDYLAERRKIKPSIRQGSYPFKDIKLSRADVEWLLSTHENERGPVNWSDESQREREGLDLRGADLRGENLERLPLAKLVAEPTYLFKEKIEQIEAATILLEGANLSQAHLEGADLSSAFFDSATNLEEIVLSTNGYYTASLCDIHWGDVNVAVVDWSTISMLGDEDEPQRYSSIDQYERAARAYRQLSVVLRNQGLNENAARFAYRAQLIQRKIFRYQRKFLQYLGSLFLDLLSGYGYKVGRCFIAYALVIGVFATIYHLLGTHPAWNESIVISMTAFHGRGFFPEQFHPGDPQALAAAIEALVGLLIEITLIATLTQRFFGK